MPGRSWPCLGGDCSSAFWLSNLSWTTSVLKSLKQECGQEPGTSLWICPVHTPWVRISHTEKLQQSPDFLPLPVPSLPSYPLFLALPLLPAWPYLCSWGSLLLQSISVAPAIKSPGLLQWYFNPTSANSHHVKILVSNENKFKNWFVNLWADSIYCFFILFII